ncbi:Steroid 5-alpha-reductase DET2 [Apostasia shenzhenica]|uniref:Steroid 5-alpha-reductase DET2 n=1 Tax=Apostasia shenzhenica TaxID=1088818 RepID=A0A2I0A9S3_9ASPA|nr:Steroid 5-alpha-reductase DET2 [Apostasia shenzhenica]
MWILGSIIFPCSSLFVKAMSLCTLASLAFGGSSEIRGVHLRYSKFVDVGNTPGKEEAKIGSRIGMLVVYTPAVFACFASFAVLDLRRRRSLLFISALTLHFLKRVLEVLFIHIYSGEAILLAMIQISISYFAVVIISTYAQLLAEASATVPSVDLIVPGLFLFIVGIIGNFYHHHLLSKLRAKKKIKNNNYNGKRSYMIPRGGLFSVVTCPHYLFEILGLFGIAFISQNLSMFSFAMGSMLFLMGRSYATKKWYLSKFDDFPANVKALIPYVF